MCNDTKSMDINYECAVWERVCMLPENVHFEREYVYGQRMCIFLENVYIYRAYMWITVIDYIDTVYVCAFIKNVHWQLVCKSIKYQ